MGVAKRRPAIHPNDMILADRIRRARPPKRDHDAVIELAQELGADVADAIDWYEDRAAQREYEGNVSRAEAERLAVEDVRSILEAKSRNHDAGGKTSAGG